MKKITLFAFKSTGSIDLLIACALFENLPFKVKSVDIVTDSFEILYKVINSHKEFEIIKEELGIEINIANYFIKNKNLIHFSYVIYKNLEKIIFKLHLHKLKIFLQLLHRFFSYLHIKSINNNLKILKKLYVNNSLIFMERNKWDQRHFFVSRNFIDREIYLIPDAPLRELTGYSNSEEFQNLKNGILFLPKGVPDSNKKMKKKFFNPIAGNIEFKKIMKKLMIAYDKKFARNNSIHLLFQKYSHKDNHPEYINSYERKKIISFLKIENIKKHFKNINLNKSIQINISKRIAVPNKSNLEDIHGTKIIINELKKSKKFLITDDNKLSIASSIKYRNVYTEFTSACFYFINSNIYINKSKSYREYIKDNLIWEDYKNFENNKNN